MKTPPLLLGAVLLFWGWQTGFLVPAAIMAAVLEGARWLRPRWEVSNDDFARIWTFCTLLLIAAVVYAFTANDGPADFRLLFQNPSGFAQRSAGTATSRTAAAVVRWLPMMFFLFVAAQTYSSREGIPLETISLILRRRWRRARKSGQPLAPSRTVDVSYPYFALCLFASSVHPSESTSFYWYACGLLGWGLWPQRSRRFGVTLWGATLAAAFGLGYLGQSGMGRLQNYLGNLNTQWFSGPSRHRFDPMRSQTQIGRIGRLKASGRIVIRLQGLTNSPPGLLREASYRAYRNHAWYADLADSDWVTVRESTNRESYTLMADKTAPSAARIACYLEGGTGLLPLPEGTGRLQGLLVFDDPQKSSLGAVMVQGPGMIQFEALFGPGATIDSPADEDQDLAVPPRETGALEQIVRELHLDEQSPDEALKSLRRFFLEKFTYRTWQPTAAWSRSRETALTRFLLRTRSGHCEYFATAGVLLLRLIGIPARYAVGYAVHEGSGSSYVVRQRDAHSWCLFWDKRAGLWRDLDLTPGTWLEAEASRASPLQFLSDGWSWVSFQFARLRWGQTHLRQYVFWIVIPILGLLLAQIIFQRRRRHRGNAGGAGSVAWPGLDSEFYELERKLAQRGLARQPSEPLSEWLQRATGEPGLARARTPLESLLLLHYRYRFDPQGLSPQERQVLRTEARQCLELVD